MTQRCTCKKEIVGWYFNFDGESPKFDRCDIVGERILKLLRKLKAVTHTDASVAKILHNIETRPELRKWFLREVKKQTHKTCYGWQCKMKITKHNKLCKLHGRIQGAKRKKS